jgi:hypothetical protein
LSLNGVVEHRDGSNRAVLRLDWRQPIALTRLECAIGGLPSCRVCAGCLRPELKRWSRGFAKLIGGCSLGQQ